MGRRDDVVNELTAPGAMFETVDAVVDGLRLRVYKNAPPTMRDVFASTIAYGDRPFLVYGDDRYSFAEHAATVATLARHWSERGIGKGDRVAIGARNYPEWVMSFWATQVMGAIAVPLNAWWTGPELEYALRDSTAVGLVVDGERLERIEPYLADLGLRSTLVVRHHGPRPARADAWDTVIGRPPGGLELPDVALEPDDLSTILYTSGTTGLPKGAVGTHRNHCHNITNTMFSGAVGGGLAGAAPNDEPASPPATLQVFPFFHIGGLTGLYVSTAFGAKLVTMYKWDTELALELLDREEITATAMVPTLLRQLLDSPSLTPARAQRLAAVSSGGAPVPPDLIRNLEATFAAKVSPGNGYGLTETTSAVIINSGQEYFEHPDSIGRVTPVTDLRIVDTDGADVRPGEIGELWVRGPNVVRGYWNKPEATAAAFTDGWFHTGDLGRQDAAGLVYVVDRLKDVVIRGGENVYCAEVEAALFEHPAVADVAVVGLPDPSLGEEVVAVVQRRPGTDLTVADLDAFCQGRLARFKVPSRVVTRDDPLPRTATGKVLKRELRDELQGAATSSPT